MARPGRASGESQRGPDRRVGLVREVGIKEGAGRGGPVRTKSDSVAEVTSPSNSFYFDRELIINSLLLLDL